jgi:N-acetylmuramoyl-L-alanine amidase
VYVVALDAGHGGIDGGVTGIKTGVKESDLNLIIAEKIEAHLLSADIGVIMTRRDKEGLYGTTEPGFKLRDLQKRAEIITRGRATAAVSIHMNFYPSETRRGCQVFYNKDSSSSKYFGELMQGMLNKRVNANENGRNYEALSGDYYIVRDVPCTAIIVECGFLSSPADERLLMTEEYQDKLAYNIFSGILAYLYTA